MFNLAYNRLYDKSGGQARRKMPHHPCFMSYNLLKIKFSIYMILTNSDSNKKLQVKLSYSAFFYILRTFLKNE